MVDLFSQEFSARLSRQGRSLARYLLSRWFFIILPALIWGGYIYYQTKSALRVYVATISFVLSTDQKGGPNGLSGLAAQLGIDATTSGGDNIFTGDNIIELFKSKLIIRQALLKEVNTSHQSLLNYIASRRYPGKTDLLPFPATADKFSAAQTGLFRAISDSVQSSFEVFKKDKKLVFYYISASSTDPLIAFYTAKIVLTQTAGYFIATKTNVALQSVKLLKKEADSIGNVLSGTFSSSMGLADRTYNLNPSLSIQRSAGQFNNAKGVALAGAYAEVMRNLEIAKINLQKETPLYRIIDEPDFPLPAEEPNALNNALLPAVKGLLIGILALSVFWMTRNYTTLFSENERKR